MSDHSDLTARSSRVFASNRDSIGHAFVVQVDYRGHIIPCCACALIEAFSAADASGRQEVFPVLPIMGALQAAYGVDVDGSWLPEGTVPDIVRRCIRSINVWETLSLMRIVANGMHISLGYLSRVSG